MYRYFPLSFFPFDLLLGLQGIWAKGVHPLQPVPVRGPNRPRLVWWWQRRATGRQGEDPWKKFTLHTFSALLGQRWSLQPRRPHQLGNWLWKKVTQLWKIENVTNKCAKYPYKSNFSCLILQKQTWRVHQDFWISHLDKKCPSVRLSFPTNQSSQFWDWTIVLKLEDAWTLL